MGAVPHFGEKRIEKALRILNAGGKVRYGLERDNYTGRDKFKYRLIDAQGKLVPGFGIGTYYEIKDLLVYRDGNSVATYYKLRKES